MVKMAKLTDIAKELGLSIATVSYVLNGRAKEKHLPEKTVRKVKEAAQRLGYLRNQSGVQLQNGHTRQVVFLSTGYDREYVFMIFIGLSDELQKYGYYCRYCHLEPVIGKSETEAEQFYNGILENRPEAVVIYDALPFCRIFTEKCRDLGIRIAAVDNAAFPDADVRVYSESRSAGEKVIDFLYERGYRSIGMIEHVQQFAKPIIAGFRNGLKKYGLSVKRVHLLRIDSAIESADDIERFLISLKTRSALPDAICCCSDYAAVKLYSAAIRMGLKIPKNLMIVGFGGLNFKDLFAPEVPTVIKYYGEIGLTTAQILYKMFCGRIDGPVIKSIECTVSDGKNQ